MIFIRKSQRQKKVTAHSFIPTLASPSLWDNVRFLLATNYTNYTNGIYPEEFGTY